ncbi:sirtuin (silent mating type information regulation 2 homolog) 3, gene 2 L homeolog [Xenopus laevis]|nr:sirtuin (silent mating type information regulation 2 homolog) 3, gene 2 L homeolog [Xenopus laevis]AAH97921.1 MGC115727 protein [Xenopus laevis]
MKALATTSAFQTTVIEDQNTQEAVDSKHPLDYLSRKRENDRLSGVIKQRKRQLPKSTLVKNISAIKPNKCPMGCKDLADILDLIARNCCRNIIVMAGAGISTASGIPDFRSPGSGIYDNLQKYDIPYPEAIFDINYFVCNPKPFFHLAKELYPGKYKPNLVHYFVRLLHDKGLLLRCYTQNIDGLERLAGIPVERIVEVHGTFSSASCSLCYTPFPANEAKELIFDGIHPCCTFCSGPVKPDIVFFGEDLPKTFTQAYQDFPKADLLIIMGTSLKIQPFASLVNIVKPSIPRLLINREKVGPFAKKRLRRRDVAELGDLCDITHTMVNGLCWEEELEKLMKSPTEQATGH